MKLYFILKEIDLNAQQAFGLDDNLVTEEKVPVLVESSQNIMLKRIQ